MKSSNRFDYENSVAPLGVMPKDYADGVEISPHTHDRGQLIYATSGLMKVSSETELWLIPPRHALWMPALREHGMVACGQVTLRTLYARNDALPPSFPTRPWTLRVSPFLHQLILRASAIPIDYAEQSHDALILAVLLGEIESAYQAVDFHLKAASDKRLARVCDAVLANPGDHTSIEQWASHVGTSSRTLARLFMKEFGVTFTHWRQQVRIMTALPRLAMGEPVTVIALELGYETPGAFTQVFRRLMGAAPSTYFQP